MDTPHPALCPRRPKRGLSRLLKARSTLARLARHARPDPRKVALTIVLALLFSATRLMEVWPLKIIIDSVLLGAGAPEALAEAFPWAAEPRNLLLLLCAWIVLNAVLGGFVFHARAIAGAKLGLAVAAQLRGAVYRHVHRLPFSYHDRRRTGDLLTRLTNDVRTVREAMVTVPAQATESCFMLVGMTAVMLVLDWRLTLVALVLLPVVWLVVRRYREPLRQQIRKQNERAGRMATTAAEALGAVRVVQGYGREEDEVARFAGATRKETRSGLRAARIEGRMQWSSDAAVGVVTALVVGIASLRVLQGALTPGDLIVFATYFRAFTRPMRRISRTLSRFARAASSGERILEVLDTPVDIADRPGALEAPDLREAIVLDDVRLEHAGRPALRGASLTIRRGERVALIGPTGAGKSSIVNLLPRFYDPSAGAVRIDGRDLRDLRIDSVRRQIAFVFQESVLFSASVAENIAYGRPGASREDIIEAARAVGIHDMIAALPDGYDTEVGERGGRLSGGQRQCVAIARAMAKDAPIVVLDEPTTGLDPDSTALVLDALDRLVAGRTVVMITHDHRTIRNADRVVLVEDGRVVDADVAWPRRPAQVAAAGAGA